MEPKQRMKLSIRKLTDDVERIGAIVRSVEHKLDTVCRSPGPPETLAQMQEELGEIHARLDGVREFILSCERRALEKPEQQDIDLWL